VGGLGVFATGLDRYESGFAEALDLLLAALPGGPVTAAGTFFRFREVTVAPRSGPVRTPGRGGGHQPGIGSPLAAARGLPMLLSLHMDDASKQDMMSHYAAAAARHQTQPAGRHMTAVATQVGDTRLEAQRLLRTELPRWLGPGLAGYIPMDGRQRAARDPVGYAELLCRIHPVGTAADCAEAMTATAQRTGISHLICMVEGSGNRAAILETSLGSARRCCRCCPAVPPARPGPGTGESETPAGR
jgi:alkanesulfonate monooxygenase SsuD/methylene tetrahydromethanopterin reductase-like flavin-dependent oxidoreductase (luciferase family)